MKKSFSVRAVVATVAAVIVATAIDASAATIILSSGGASCTISDGALSAICAGGGTATGDLSGTGGVVTSSVSVGNFTLNITTGASNFAPTIMDLNDISGSNAAGGDLTIQFSETGFADITGVNMKFAGTLDAPAGSTVSVANWFGSSNTLFSLGTLLGSFGAFGPGAFSQTQVAGLPGSPNPFSLTQVLTIHSTGSLLYSGDASMSPVPEPATMVLLGTGLLAAFRARRKSA
jgi:hypothetical protein